MIKFGLNVSFILLLYVFQTIFVITICHAEHEFVTANNNELQACLSSSLPLSVRTVYPCDTSTNQNSSQYQCGYFDIKSLSAQNGGRIPHSPAVVVHVTDSNDIQKVVKCAIKLNYTVNPSSGAHSYEGYNLGSEHNNIIINLAGINYINIDASDGTARIGAGARHGPIYYRTYQSDGYTINGGTSVWVGITGLALGGGAGLLSRLHGLLSDNVLELKAVNADGELLTINATHEVELYWALRGAGGGLFVIVTELKLQLVKAPSLVTMFQARWYTNATKLVIRRYQSILFNETAWNSNNNIYIIMDVRSTYVMILMTNFGTKLEDFNKIVCLFLTTLPPPYEMSRVTPDWLTFVNRNENHAQLLLENMTHSGSYFKGKHLFYDRPISDYSLDQFLERLSLRNDGFAMEFTPMDGYLSTIPVDKTAFPHRHYKFGIQFMAFSSQQLNVQELNWLNQSYCTPLDDYVHKPDPVFAWKRIQIFPYSTHTIHILNMTSQQWFNGILNKNSTSFSSRSIWWHYMIITVPKILKRSQTAFLLISGGSNNNPIPTESWTTDVALNTGSVAIELRQIPNQPIQFMADPFNKSRTEDEIIAWTWKTFIETNGSDPYILLRMPMTKAVVRGMDATQAFLRQQEIPVPEHFIISGLSKRGWTTWTTAAVDNTRVIGAIPIVMDMLNIRQNMKSHYRSLAGWTYDFDDYYIENITMYLDNPYFQAMADIVDPYSYFDRYRNTRIYQIQAADDEFFLPDSEDFFWNDLQNATGGSFLRRIPNVGHSITGYNESLISFYLSVYDQQKLPLVTWNRTIYDSYAEIIAAVDIGDEHPHPISAVGFKAQTTTGTKRDFRQKVLDPATGKVVPNPVVWVQENENIEISQVDETVYFTFKSYFPPEGHWEGMFIQFTFPGSDNTTLILTTETLILPNKYPADPCFGQQCYGTLV
ncbi:unnamed protein product [Adineta steineri]|uniref:FAD-binding PCMH-type domain-containing protein n=1 Tax=Adineta steineri TaxID=433720 RepID=A0A819G9I3_9BILA|nr:unnamed protein product [Adineta steineri]